MLMLLMFEFVGGDVDRMYESAMGSRICLLSLLLSVRVLPVFSRLQTSSVAWYRRVPPVFTLDALVFGVELLEPGLGWWCRSARLSPPSTRGSRCREALKVNWAYPVCKLLVAVAAAVTGDA